MSFSAILLAASSLTVSSYITDTVGNDAIQAIREKEGGEAFLQKFFSDRDWMEQFAGSGTWGIEPWRGMDEVKGNAAKALTALDLLAFNDETGKIYTDKTVRNIATALALSHGYDWDEEKLVDAFQLYSEWVEDGTLVDPAYAFDVRKWREVLGFGQNAHLTTDDLLWIHDFANVGEGVYGGLCWSCAYRTFNCFGDSIHGPNYYRYWRHAMIEQEMRYRVGGVCGALSKFGSHAAEAHGVRSFTAGQPGHCAYMVHNEAENKWNVHYSVTGHTTPHNTLGGARFTSIEEQDRYFDNPDRMEAEYLRWEGKFEESMRKAHGNWMAAISWYNKLVKDKASSEEWARYGKALRETFADFPCEGYQLYFEYLNKLPNKNEKIAAAIHGLLKIHESDLKTSENIYFDELVLNPMMKMFDKNEIWEILTAALDGQEKTPTFYRQTISWGAKNLINDEASVNRFMRILGASVRKSGNKLDYTDMLLAGSTKGDIEMMRQVYELLDKCSPELATKRTTAKWSAEKLLSKDGVLMTSSTSRWDWPINYRHALDEFDFVEGNAFHTNKETAPWGMVKLPGPANIKKITVVNSGNRPNDARQIPLEISISDDGKTFTKVGSFTKVQNEWTVEFATDMKARYVKVGRVEDKNRPEFFHLKKILVYGDKLY